MSAEVIMDVVDDPTMKTFYCPGCKCGHYIKTDRWTWDGNREAPTVTPSILVNYDGPDAGVDGAPPKVCHLFVTAGKLHFLSDCTHPLAGQTVPMEQP